MLLLRNNAIAFAGHLAVLVLSALQLSDTDQSAALYVRFVIMMAVYAAIGFFLLRPLGSVAANLLSVSAVSLIGLLLGVYGWAAPGSMGFHWLYYAIYNAHLFLLAEAVRSSLKPLPFFWLFALPSLLLWTGLELRARWIQTAKARI